MSLFQIDYDYLGVIVSVHVAAVDIESAIKRFRQLFKEGIVRVIQYDTNLIT